MVIDANLGLCTRFGCVLVDCGCVCAGVDSRNMEQRYNGRKHDGLFLYQASRVKVQQKKKVQFSGRNRVRVWVHETSEQNVPKLAEENLQKLRIPRQCIGVRNSSSHTHPYTERDGSFSSFSGVYPHTRNPPLLPSSSSQRGEFLALETHVYYPFTDTTTE